MMDMGRKISRSTSLVVIDALDQHSQGATMFGISSWMF